jgi:hypothetical protein
MIKRIPILALMALAVFCLFSQGALAQGTSVIDTFKVEDVTATAGSTFPVKLFVVNDSLNLGSITAYFRIDTNVVKFVGVRDSNTTTNEVTFAITNSLVDRGAAVANMFSFAKTVKTSDSVTAAMVGIGIDAEIPRGRGNVWEILLRVKPNVGNGTTTLIQLYNPDDQGTGDNRSCGYNDALGTQDDVRPTLVSGTLTVGNVIPGHNSPPVINALSTTAYNVQLGATVNFNVTATDPDSPQKITLRANGLPSGATFGSSGVVTGNGVASGTFNWPNIQQVGNFTVTFTCVDDSGASATARAVSINVGTPAPTEDILYTASSTTYRAIAGGIPGLSDVAIPINMANLNDVYGVQFDMVYNSNAFSIDSLVQTDRLKDFTVYDNVGGSPGRVRVVAFGLNNQKVLDGTTSAGTALFNFWVTIRPNAPVGETEIHFENAWESVNPNPAVASVKLKFDTTGVFAVDNFGDINGDGRVDVADAVIAVGYIIGDHTLSRRQMSAADMDQNLAVDVVDLVAIINQIFGSVPPSVPQWSGKDAIVRLGDDNGVVVGNSIDVNADLPTSIAGVQMEIGYNPSKIRFAMPETTDKSAHLNLRYRDDGKGKIVILLYPKATTGSHIEAGTGAMLKLPVISLGELASDGKDVQIQTAVLSDPNAVSIPVKGFKPAVPTEFTLDQNYPNPFNPETTIDFAVASGSANKPVRLVIYNLLGEKVSTLIDEPLPAGKYSYKWRGTDDRGLSTASGVYFYRLTVGDQSQTRKMVLLK